MQEPTFLILTALAARAQHGYGIMTDVARISDGRVRLRAGTLYAALDRLKADGLVTSDKDEVVDGRLRRYYRITDEGAEELAAEVDRLRANAAVAASRLGPSRGDRMSEMEAARRRAESREKRYRRLLALYPKDHRREHAEEMVGVLLAAAGDAQVRAPKPVAWALRFGQHTADCADLVAGALRIRGRMVLNRIRRAPWFSRTVRDQRWSDALAVVSVVAPLLLLVAALAEVHIPQAAASSVTGHPQWQLTGALGLADLPLAAGAPAVAVLAFLRLRRTAGMVALAAAIGQVVSGILRSSPAFTRYESPAVAFTVLLACTAAAALLLSPGPDRGLALLTPGGTALVGSRCADPRRVQRGRRHVVRCRVPPVVRVRRLPRRGGRPARRSADRRRPGHRRGGLPARPGQPPGSRAAGHPGHPLRGPVAREAGW